MTTPGGRPGKNLVNPPSSEVGPMDSGGGGQLLLGEDPFRRGSLVARSPPTNINCSLENQNSQIPTLEVPEDTISRLQAQLNSAYNEIRRLQEEIKKLQPRVSYSPANSEEEEEIVAKETAWILEKNKKRKRKTMESPETPKTSPINKSKRTKENVKKSAKPPPVILSNVENYIEISQKLKSKDLKFNTSMMNNNQLKINVDTEMEYRELTKLLKESKLEWHTYENKQTRPIRVMARNLHPTCKSEEIKEELLNRGYKVLEVVNKIRKTKVDGKEKIIHLPLFMLTFDRSEDIKKIFDIQYLCHMKIKIEALRSNKLIPQCKRCQRYGHTHKYCQHGPICVKCAGNHRTIDCQQERDVPAKCSNCAEAHPASYRGCLVARELQIRRNNLISERRPKKPQPRTFTANKINSEMSFAQAVKANKTLVQNDDSSMVQMMQNMMDMMKIVMDRLDRLEARNPGTIPQRTNQWTRKT